MIHRLFTAASALTLLACAAIIALWVDGRFVTNDVVIDTPKAMTRIQIDRDELYLSHTSPRDWRLEHHRSYWKWSIEFNRYRPFRAPTGRSWWKPITVREETMLYHGRAIILKLWFLAVMTSALPACWTIRVVPKVRARLRIRSIRCASCGYDLRASQARCPECGTPIPLTQESASF